MNNSYETESSGLSSNDVSNETVTGLCLQYEGDIHLPKLLQPTGSFSSTLSTEIPDDPTKYAITNKYPTIAENCEDGKDGRDEKNLETISTNVLCKVSQKDGEETFTIRNETSQKGNSTSCIEIVSNMPHKDIMRKKPSSAKDAFIKDLSVIISNDPMQLKKLTRLLKQSNINGNLKSPDLFYDSSDDDNKEEIRSCVVPVAIKLENGVQANNNNEYEKNILKNIKSSLTGVPPPPSITNPQIDLFEEIHSRKDAILSFLEEFRHSSESKIIGNDNKVDSIQSRSSLTLWRPTHSVEEVKTLSWKDVFQAKQHGLCYNITKDSEAIEYLNLAVVERFIGAETASSYRNPSSLQVKSPSLRMMKKSPGSRLSHLAKRRAVFSSASLAQAAQKANALMGRQVMLDQGKGKIRRKIISPKRTTPGSKRAQKSPTLVSTRDLPRRALFQSPLKKVSEQPSKCLQSLAPMSDISMRVEKSKRALHFSPQNRRNTVVQHNKRKRESTEDVEISNNNPTSCVLRFKRQSFCTGTDTHHTASNRNLSELKSSEESRHATTIRNEEQTNKMDDIMQKSRSEPTAKVYNLTECQRKKILWAISYALREKQINSEHEKFKDYASILARVVKRLFEEYYHQHCVSTSETLLKLARQHVYYVTKNMSVEDIYKRAMEKLLKSKVGAKKISGYIGPNEHTEAQKEKMQLIVAQDACKLLNNEGSCKPTAHLVYQEPVDDSGTNSIPEDNSSILEQGDNKSVVPNTNSLQSGKKSSLLTNSSSKSNINGSVLQENSDCDLRMSAQKSSISKEHLRSPYFGVAGNCNSAVKTPGRGTSDTNMAMVSRVKRHILFEI